MTNGTHRLVASGTLALALSLAPPARAEDTEPGVWWEETIQASMQGMSMSARTVRVCVSKKGMTEPPGPGSDQRCKMTDVKTVGDRMTWKVECGEPERMTGEGDITRGKDSYTGSLAMHSAQGDMTMKMKGKLVGGDCDASAVRKRAAALEKEMKEREGQQKQWEEKQRQAEAARIAQECDQAIEKVQLAMFSGPQARCKAPQHVTKVCARMTTREGYTAFREAGDDPEVLRLGKELCKKDPEAVRTELCTTAAAEASSANRPSVGAATRKKPQPGRAAPQDPLDFLAANCPDESRELARNMCAGRSFTGMPPGERQLCVQYAREVLSGGGQTQPASGDAAKGVEEKQGAKEQAKEGAKKVLKGLFGK